MTHFYFLQKVQNWKEKERDSLHIYKTLNSWGDTKDGKNLSKKNGFVVVTRQKKRGGRKRFGQSITSTSIITMAKASPEDLKALFDTQQGYDDALL